MPVAARYAADLLRWNWDFGERSGVPERDRLLFALSAYNAGGGGALAAGGLRLEQAHAARR